MADTVHLGTVTPSTTSSELDVFIRHDGLVNPITDCAFYINKYAGTSYQGDDADDDYTELFDWGDAGSGGLLLNQKVPAGWAEGDPFGSANWKRIKRGYGDINNQIVMSQNAISQGDPGGEDGKIPVGGEAHIQLKWQSPASVPNGAGYRAVTIVFAFSATS
jgi:hypothetical protein